MIQMNTAHKISMKELGQSNVLAGAAAGYDVQRKTLEALASARTELCCLDFSAVECATASFLREAVFGVRDAAKRAELNVQIVVSNASPVVQEEISLAAKSLGTSVVHATLGGRNTAPQGRVLGILDEAQRETLELVIRRGEATATDLTEVNPNVKLTAWNNRLATLVQRGLVTESRRDRHKLFRPILKGLTYGR